MAAKVFISYRREDSAAYAGRIRDRLEREFGRDLLFIDVDGIPLGANFVKVLREEITKCSVLLAVIGPRWLDARDEDGTRRLDNPEDFVRIEIAVALQREIPTIPILLDGTKIPKTAQLPKDLEELALRNGHNVRHASFHTDMDKLIQELKGQVGVETTPGDCKEAAQLTLIPAPLPVKVESAQGLRWDYVQWEWWGAPSERGGQVPKSWITVRAQRAMLAESLQEISEDVKAIRRVIPLAWSDDESLVRAYLGLQMVELSGAAFLRNIGKTPVKIRLLQGDHYNMRYHRPLVDPQWQELVEARLRKEWEEHAEANSALRVSVELAPDTLISLEPNEDVEVAMSFRFTAHSRREYTDEVQAQKNYTAYAREKEKELLVNLACADALFEYVRGAIRGVPVQLTVFGEERVIKADLEPVAIPAKVDFSDPDWNLVEQLSKTLSVDVLDIGERWKRIVTAVDKHWDSAPGVDDT